VLDPTYGQSRDGGEQQSELPNLQAPCLPPSAPPENTKGTLMLLYWLRVGCLLLWAAAALVLAPGALRYVRGRFDGCDAYRTAFFFTALLFIGSLSRWILAPDDEEIFVALYAMTAALAVYVMILAVQGRPPR
jgi:hypothetical protein